MNRLILAACLFAMTAPLGACLNRVGPRVAAPPAHTAQGMVQAWERKKQDETRCTMEEAGAQITKKAGDRRANPSCGNYGS